MAEVTHQEGEPLVDLIDFPVGNVSKNVHPKIALLWFLIDNHCLEYDEAAQMTEERLYHGRRMRSKSELIQWVVTQVRPDKGGYYKKRTKNGNWFIDRNYTDLKLRRRISNMFNAHLNKRIRVSDLPMLAELASQSPSFINQNHLKGTSLDGSCARGLSKPEVSARFSQDAPWTIDIAAQKGWVGEEKPLVDQDHLKITSPSLESRVLNKCELGDKVCQVTPSTVGVKTSDSLIDQDHLKITSPSLESRVLNKCELGDKVCQVTHSTVGVKISDSFVDQNHLKMTSPSLESRVLNKCELGDKVCQVTPSTVGVKISDSSRGDEQEIDWALSNGHEDASFSVLSEPSWEGVRNKDSNNDIGIDNGENKHSRSGSSMHSTEPKRKLPRMCIKEVKVTDELSQANLYQQDLVRRSRRRMVMPPSKTVAQANRSSTRTARSMLRGEASFKDGNADSIRHNITVPNFYEEKKFQVCGTDKTMEDIAQGKTVIVRCPACRTMLQVAKKVKLLYCTQCQAASHMDLIMGVTGNDYSHIANEVQKQEITAVFPHSTSCPSVPSVPNNTSGTNNRETSQRLRCPACGTMLEVAKKAKLLYCTQCQAASHVDLVMGVTGNDDSHIANEVQKQEITAVFPHSTPCPSVPSVPNNTSGTNNRETSQKRNQRHRKGLVRGREFVERLVERVSQRTEGTIGGGSRHESNLHQEESRDDMTAATEVTSTEELLSVNFTRPTPRPITPYLNILNTSNDAEVVMTSLEEIAIMLIEEDRAEDMEARLEIESAVSNVMNNTNLDREDILRGCFCVLGSLYDFRGMRSPQQLIEGILAAMKRHRENQELQRSGCGTLNIVAANHVENRTLIVQRGGIATLLTAMEVHGNGDPLVHSNGCFALGNLAANHRGNQSILSKTGGIQAVLKAMESHPDDAEVQSKACWAIGNLAANHTNNQTAIAKAGGVLAVVRAMQNNTESGKFDCCATGDASSANQHSRCARVQEQGCFALGQLAANHSENQTKIAASGGIRQVKTAIVDFWDDVKVQGNACLALGHLTTEHVDNQTKVCEVGGIDEVVISMRDHWNERNVQNAGCFALGAITANHTDNQVATQMAGGIEAVVSGMNTHPDDAAVQDNGCYALGCLAANHADNQTGIAKAGGVEVLVTAMNGHSNSMDVQDSACFALGNLAHHHEDNQTTIGEAGGILTIVKAVKQYYFSTGCWAIGSLAENHAHNQTVIGAGGGIDVLLAVLRKGNEEALEDACFGLLMIAVRHSYNQELLETAGCVAAVVTVMQRIGATPAIQTLGRAVLDLLNVVCYS